ncbi:hypothetical protein ACFQVA_13675 [Actinomadura keratinilytica]
MIPRHEIPRTARARAFVSFAAGAGGRLLHLAALLTGEPPAAPRTPAACSPPRSAAPTPTGTPCAATTRTTAPAGTSSPATPVPPGTAARRGRADAGPWSPRPAHPARARRGGPEAVRGVPEEQAAALLGLPVERVRALTARATVRLARPPGGAPGAPEPAR